MDYNNNSHIAGSKHSILQCVSTNNKVVTRHLTPICTGPHRPVPGYWEAAPYHSMSHLGVACWVAPVALYR